MLHSKITKEQIRKAERIARREAEIENRIPHVRSTVHKSKKGYNRQENKKVNFYLVDSDF